MAVSESVLNAVNLFSSTSVFNANKGSVGATDLNFIKQTTAELATEGGGIIAQSLGTNGYVKFANGLILQWGVKTNSSNAENLQITYPISFTNAYSSVGSRTANGATSYWPFVIDSSDFTNTGFQAHTAGNVYWHAIGI